MLYKPGYGGDKAVALRVSQLQGEYRRGALKVDRELGHEDGAGPTIRKLESPVLKINDHATGGRRTKDILGGPKSLETKTLGSSKG